MIVANLPYFSPGHLNATGVTDNHPAGNEDEEDEDVVYDKHDRPDKPPANKMPTIKKVASTAASSEVAEVTPMTTKKAAAAAKPPFLLDAHDGYVVAYYTEDGLNYAEVEVIVNGVLPANGYRFEVRPDGMAVTWMRSFHRVCFSKDHLQATMGSSYSLSNSRVVAYDNVTEEMKKSKVTPDASRLYWGEPQVVPLKSKVTGTPKISFIRFPTGETAERKGKKHLQFSSIYYCRIMLAEQRSANNAKVESKVVDLLDLPSSQSSDNSPPPRCKKRAHRGGGHEVRDDDDDENDDDDDGGYGGGYGGGGGMGGGRNRGVKW